MNLFIFFFISYIACIIPITEQIKSRFKAIEHPQASKKSDQLKLYSISDVTYKYNKLGSNNDLIIDQVKLSNKLNSNDLDGQPVAAATEANTNTATASFEDNVAILTPIIYKLKATKRYIKDFLKFKDKEVIQQSLPNPKLSTSIKNYDTTLNKLDDLKAYTSKIIQERVEDDSFDDHNFKQFGQHKSLTPSLLKISFDPKLQMHEFINYLVKFEGFDFDDLKFLLKSTDLDFGLNELEDQLNIIKDEQNKRQIIEVIGDNVGMSLSVSFVNLFGFFLLSSGFI